MEGKGKYGVKDTGAITNDAHRENMEDQYFAMSDTDYSMHYNAHKQSIKQHDAKMITGHKLKDYRQN